MNPIPTPKDCHLDKALLLIAQQINLLRERNIIDPNSVTEVRVMGIQENLLPECKLGLEEAGWRVGNIYQPEDSYATVFPIISMEHK